MVALSQQHVLLIVVMVVHDIIGRSGASIGNGDGASGGNIGSVGTGCSDVCDYNEWGKDARCEFRHLRAIPQECRDAKTLRVQDNRIPRLQSGAFRNFTCLKYLYLQGNNLTLEPGSFLGCSKVQQIHLNGNDVPALTPEITAGLSSVLFMYADNVGVQNVLADTFKDMTFLQFISLKNNRLTAPPCEAFGTDSLIRTLYLSDNMISTLPDSCFGGLPYLNKLYLNNNSLTSVNPEAFRGLDSLTLLNLENTNLAQVPTGIFPLANKIKMLHLSFNKIRHLSNRDFLGLLGLEELYLQYNLITDIHPQAFEFLSTLRILNISYNSLRSIGYGALRGQTQLEELALQDNQLNSTKNITFSVIPSGAKVRLENNPLHCDCSLYPFMYWLETTPKPATDQDSASATKEASCTSPAKFAGQLVIDLSQDDICPPNVHQRTSRPTIMPHMAAQQAGGVQQETDDGMTQTLSTVQLVAIFTAVIIVIIVFGGIVAWMFIRRRYNYEPAHANKDYKHPNINKPLPQHAGHDQHPGNVTNNHLPPELPPPRRDSQPPAAGRNFSVSSTDPLLPTCHSEASIRQNTGYITQDALPHLTRGFTAPELGPTQEMPESDGEEDAFYDKVQIGVEDDDEPPEKWIKRTFDSSPTTTCPSGGYPFSSPGKPEGGYMPWKPEPVKT